MHYIKQPLLFILAIFLLGGSQCLLAENSKEFNQHIIYYNAFPTDTLPTQVTKQYGLKRSKNMAMVNLSVVKKGDGSMPFGMKASIKGTLKNLMGQSRDIEFREIKEGHAVYYIAQIGVQNKEVVNFYIDIKPDGSDDKYEIKFSKKFVTQ